jgi:hypothetical protein
MGPEARKTSHDLAASMLNDLLTHLRQTPFGGASEV